MRRAILIAGVAALTVTVPALAGDQGRGRGQGQAAESNQKGGGKGRAERGRGRGDQQARERRREDRARRVERGREDRVRGVERRRDERQRRAERGRDDRDRRVERLRDERERRLERRLDQRERRVERAIRDDRRDWRGWVDRRLVLQDRFDDDLIRFREVNGRRLAIGPTGCPPGLARQNVFCMPPGQLRKAQLIGQRLPLAGLLGVPDRYRYRFRDNDRYLFRYGDDGTVYRIDRTTGLLSSVVPIAGGLFPGAPLPLGYDVYNVPLAYRDRYPDSDDYLYRYYGNGIYRVDRDTMLVDSVAALLTGGAGGLGGLGVGDPLPLGYDAYNVPLAYRDTYYDRPDSLYRYADGSIYQVDPETRLIQAIISLLV